MRRQRLAERRRVPSQLACDSGPEATEPVVDRIVVDGEVVIAARVSPGTDMALTLAGYEACRGIV